MCRANFVPQPLLYTTNVGLPLANVAHQSFSMLTKYQLTDSLGTRRAGGVSVKDIWRHAAGREPGDVDPGLLAL